MAEKMSATAKGMSLPISRKQAVEVCRFIKRRDIAAVRRRLNRVLELKMAVPSTKFKRDIPHRSGSVGPGRFPIKAAKAILDVVNSAVSNAENKGMKASSLYIVKASACKGPTSWHYGRQSRRHAKRTHVEIVLEELENSKFSAPRNKVSMEMDKKVNKPVKAKAVEAKAEHKAEVKKEAHEVSKAPSEEKK